MSFQNQDRRRYRAPLKIIHTRPPKRIMQKSVVADWISPSRAAYSDMTTFVFGIILLVIIALGIFFGRNNNNNNRSFN